MSSRKQIKSHFKDYLAEVSQGSAADADQLKNKTNALFKAAHRLNVQEGGEAGTHAIYHEANKHIDLKKFMDSLSEKQLATIRSKISSTGNTDMVGGGGDYTILEIVLGIIFFPWSLVYFFFLR